MKLKAVLLISGIILLIGLSSWIGSEQRNDITLISSENEGVAVMELFTSQGCSSCPPAERVFHSWLEEAEKKDLPLIGLAYHVDYWDYLGWKDPYSSAEWSTRQRDYNVFLRNSPIYTPQLIVNGRREMVGSDYAKVSNSIRSALEMKPEANVKTKLEFTPSTRRLAISYQLQGDWKGNYLQLALTQSNLEDKILRGENRGRTLIHNQVVRKLDSIEPDSNSGRYVITVDEGIDLSAASLIAFVQEKGTWKILGAAQNMIPIAQAK